MLRMPERRPCLTRIQASLIRLSLCGQSPFWRVP